FRNGEAGRRHNPEFTMLEWYRRGWDHHRLMQETVALVEAALTLVDRTAQVSSLTYRDLFLDCLQIDPFVAPLEALRAPLQDWNIDTRNLERDDWLDLLITHCIQPQFPW